MRSSKRQDNRFRLTRWGIVSLALVLAFGSVGIAYAAKNLDKPLKVAPATSLSDPFTWVVSNDDGSVQNISPYGNIDPGDDGGGTNYDMWLAASSDDPYQQQALGIPALRYDKDVAKTVAWLGTVGPGDPNPDKKYITVIVENAYPGYHPTVFFALECGAGKGKITNIVIDEIADDGDTPPEPDEIPDLTVTYSGIYIGQEIPAGGEVTGALHILVNQIAKQNATYRLRLSISTECGVRVTGTAYAYGGTYAKCFTQYGFSNWGWTNGPLPKTGTYNFPMYVGASNCLPSPAKLVGTFTIKFNGTTATVTYTMNAGYTMDSTHVWIGTEPFPRKSGKYTNAPGQFPYKHENLGGVATDSYTITGLPAGNVYVIGHAVVAWFE